jgi:hypothetical protein
MSGAPCQADGGVRGGLTPGTGVRRRPPADHQRTRGGPCGNHRGHGHSSGARPAAMFGTAAIAGHGRVQAGEHGRCPAALPPRGPCGTSAVLSRTLPDTSATAVRRAVQVTDTRGRLPHRSRPPSVVLQELVARLAAAGGMQPAPVDASEPGGQPAAELAADAGHRRPGK